MQKRYKIFFLVLLLIYPAYKGIRELTWVSRSTYTINNTIRIDLRIDDDIVYFQDPGRDKTITITNLATKAKTKVSYVSIAPDLYFYIDTIHAVQTFAIADKFAGQNTYDLATLKLLSNEDCFAAFGGCGGFSDSSFAQLGKPLLIYDITGFHR